MKLRHNKHGKHGAATLELALTLTILLAVTYGTIEFGQYFYVKNQLQGAAREGVRTAVTNGATQSDITSAVAHVMDVAGLKNSGYSTTIKVKNAVANISSAQSGDQVSVEVQCTWGTVGSGYRPFTLIGANKVVKGIAVMRKE